MMMMMMNFDVLVIRGMSIRSSLYLPVFVAHYWNCRLSCRLRSADTRQFSFSLTLNDAGISQQYLPRGLVSNMR